MLVLAPASAVDSQKTLIVDRQHQFCHEDVTILTRNQILLLPDHSVMVGEIRMRWRWTSTPLSADRGEISVLAVIETIVAMSVSLWIAWQFQTITHIAASACMAPFLLFRTKRTTVLGVKTLSQLMNPIMDGFVKIPDKSLKICYIVLVWPIIIVAPIVLKICITIFGLISRPIFTISHVNINWKRVVFCIDTCHSPEAIPGMERLSGKYFNDKGISFRESTQIRQVAERYREIFSIPIFVSYVPLFIGSIIVFAIWYFPSIIYRFSLKSTSIVWSPLLWVVSSTEKSKIPRIQLERICEFAIYKAMRVYSILIAVAFFFKISILLHWYRIEGIVADGPLAFITRSYIVPDQLPLWQLAAGINALLAWALYFWADAQLKGMRFEHPSRHSERDITVRLGVFSVVRAILAFYTIACTLYIAVSIAANTRWPPIEFILFPTAL